MKRKKGYFCQNIFYEDMKFNKTSALCIVLAAVIIQAVIITYNNYTGYIRLHSIVDFLTRLVFGSVFSSLIGFILFIIDLRFINYFNRQYIWTHFVIKRIAGELFFTVLTGIIVGGFLTLLLNLVFPYKDNVISVIITNTGITSIVNLIYVIVLEAIIFFNESKNSQLKAERLEKENAEIRLETLKSQLNPHFLFNSLNALSALIIKDQAKAQFFVEEFSIIYRYILDSINIQLVPLNDELEFSKSFFNLQKVRFNDSITLDVQVNIEQLNFLIPPLSIQTLIENAIKHNICSVENPLNIFIMSNGNSIIVSNSYKPKLKVEHSKGIGLSNLKKRYELLMEVTPEFYISEDKFIGILPIIEED